MTTTRPVPGLRVSILWVLTAAVASTAGVLALLAEGRSGAVPLVMLAFSSIIWAFLSWRVFMMVRGMRVFLLHLLDNNYSTGIRIGGPLQDELHAISRLADRAASQLGEYADLSSERIRILGREVDLLLRTSDTAVMVADMHRSEFRINPAIQRLYGIEQETFSFESIQKQDGNERFFRTFLVSTLRDGAVREGTTSLQLPLRESRRNVAFRIVPIKDRRERTALALIFIDPLKEKDEDQPSE